MAPPGPERAGPLKSLEERPAMARRRRIYEGKAKVLFEGPEPGPLSSTTARKNVGSGPFLDIIDVVEEETATLPEGITAEVAGFDRLAHESSIQIIATLVILAALLRWIPGEAADDPLGRGDPLHRVPAGDDGSGRAERPDPARPCLFPR